ncbi:MAG: hypothetical protein R3213_08470 [Flavobacteriaceae bacterium]|nr:hypothetical protein [Flavobacteriaceae bacterium]
MSGIDIKEIMSRLPGWRKSGAPMDLTNAVWRMVNEIKQLRADLIVLKNLHKQCNVTDVVKVEGEEE